TGKSGSERGQSARRRSGRTQREAGSASLGTMGVPGGDERFPGVGSISRVFLQSSWNPGGSRRPARSTGDAPRGHEGRDISAGNRPPAGEDIAERLRGIQGRFGQNAGTRCEKTEIGIESSAFRLSSRFPIYCGGAK